MSDDPANAPQGSAEKDPSDWVTGDEPMTGAQSSYLHTLAQQAGEEVPDNLTKADASKLIDELQDRTGRGQVMTISADDVRRLLAADDADAVLVLIEGRTEVVGERQLDSDEYLGALQVVARDELLKRTGGGELSDRVISEQAAVLDTAVSELGG